MGNGANGVWGNSWTVRIFCHNLLQFFWKIYTQNVLLYTLHFKLPIVHFHCRYCNVSSWAGSQRLVFCINGTNAFEGGIRVMKVKVRWFSGCSGKPASAGKRGVRFPGGRVSDVGCFSEDALCLSSNKKVWPTKRVNL